MSNNNDGAVRAFSETAFSRGVHVGGSEPANNGALPTERASSVWVGGAAPSEPTRSTPAPSFADVIETTQNRVDGIDFDQHRGGGIMQTARDGHTMDIIRNRPIAATDFVVITTSTGKKMNVRVRAALAEGFLGQNADGSYFEVDRKSQQIIADQLTAVEAAQRKAGEFHHDPSVEAAVQGQVAMMAEVGLDWATEFTTYVATGGERVSPPAADFFASHGLDLKQEMNRFVWALRSAVEQEVLRPNAIDPTVFLDWIETSGMHKQKAVAAALYAVHARSLDRWKSLAREFLDTGGRARQARRG
jgi:hypothetical protein